MKKVFSLILAVAMVLALGAVAFAAPAENDSYAYLDEKIKNVCCYGFDNDIYKLDTTKHELAAAGRLVFGKTYYIPIVANYVGFITVNGVVIDCTPDDDDVYKTLAYATFAKQVGSLNATATWTEGGEFVESVGIEQIFVAEDLEAGVMNRNIYAIAIHTTGSATKEKAIVGEIQVTGKSGSGTEAFKVDTKIPVDEKIYYDTATFDTTGTTAKINATGTTKKTNVEYTTTEAVTSVEFNGDFKATVENSMADKKYLVTFNSIDDEAVVAANPDAAIMFYNITFNFRENAEIEVKAIDEEADNYMYQKLANGTVVDLTSTYSEDDGAFTFTARKLSGSYMVSDKPLVF